MNPFPSFLLLALSLSRVITGALGGLKQTVQAGSATALRLEPSVRKCKRGKGVATWGYLTIFFSLVFFMGSSQVQETPHSVTDGAGASPSVGREMDQYVTVSLKQTENDHVTARRIMSAAVTRRQSYCEKEHSLGRESPGSALSREI